MKKFEDFLQEQFNEEREIGGVPITKDNCEDMFDKWVEDLDVSELIELADEYGRQVFSAAQDEMNII